MKLTPRVGHKSNLGVLLVCRAWHSSSPVKSGPRVVVAKCSEPQADSGDAMGEESS